jgi:two-component sensor histidine kinase
MLKSGIMVNNKKVGSIEVFYLEERSELYEGPFLREERDLINSIASRLGLIFKNKKIDEQIKKDLKEKNVMLQEIHHRVKNNMQIISSILHLQSQRITDKKSMMSLQVCRDRIKTMALIHENLYESQNLAEVDMASYTKKMTTHLFSVNSTLSNRINLKVDIENIFLDINRAIPVGLIINELVTNAFTHGFPENKKGSVFVQIKLLGKDTYNLIVFDNGVGLPERYEWTNPKTLGLQLVSSLVNQINGTLNINRLKGTRVQIKF